MKAINIKWAQIETWKYKNSCRQKREILMIWQTNMKYLIIYQMKLDFVIIDLMWLIKDGENFMSLIKYLKENKIDQIEDDQEFIKEEYNAIQTYCENCKYCITADDFKVIKSRGLGDSFLLWKETY